MKPWDELTERGKHRRLRALAVAALGDFDVEVTRLRLVGGFTNVIFRVDTTDGPLALRVDLFQDHSDADVEIELGWIEAIAADTDVRVGRPVRTSDGRLFTHASAPGVPEPRRCTLFTWVPGGVLGDRMTPERLHEMGVISATLHDHGAEWTPPARPMAWDRVFYWPDHVDPYVLDAAEHAHHFDAHRRRVLERAIALVEPAFAEVETGAQIVHGDLHFENVHVARNRLFVIDFEDVMWAHPVQDVAITFYYLQSDAAAEFRAAFRRGYETRRAWPEQRPGQIEAFVAARALMFANFVLNVLDDPDEFYDAAFPRLERFVDTWG